jgi:hypothetical protein
MGVKKLLTVLYNLCRTPSIELTFDVCIDNSCPLLAIEFKQIKAAFINATQRGVMIRYTDITIDSVGYCNELISIVNELSHWMPLSETSYRRRVCCAIYPL